MHYYVFCVNIITNQQLLFLSKIFLFCWDLYLMALILPLGALNAHYSVHLGGGFTTESITDYISRYFIVIMIKLKAYPDYYMNCRTCSWDGWRLGNLRSWGRVGFCSCIHRFFPRYLFKPVQTSPNKFKPIQTCPNQTKPV